MTTNEVYDFQYGWQHSHAVLSHGYLLPAVSKFLSTSTSKRVVDIGASNGSLARAVSQLGFSVTAIEPSGDGVAQMQVDSTIEDARQGSVYDSPPDDLRGAIEYAYSLEVIEHLQFPAKLFNYAHALLADDGRFLVSTPYHGYLKNLALSVTNSWDKHADPFWDYGHIRFFSIKTLTRMARENGFEVEKVHRLGRIPPLAKSMAIEFRKVPSS